METHPHIDWQQRYIDLEQRYIALEQRFAETEKRFVELEKRYTDLLVKHQELQEQVKTNSKNSSKPPSQDPNGPKRHSKPSGKKRGGQPGHPGHMKKAYPPEAVTKTIEVRPEKCPNCSSNCFNSLPVSIECRQVIDLPEIVPDVIHYNIHTCQCSACGTHVRANVPVEAERGFGSRFMAFVTMLTGEGHLSKRKICAISGHLGLSISLGALCNIHKLAGSLLQAPAQAIQDHVLAQAHVNGDETGWFLQNKRHWVWVGATRNATFFKIDPKRSQAAYRRVFGEFQGTLTTDRHGGYNEHTGNKQCCLAHIDRDCAKISERPNMDGLIGRMFQTQLDYIFGSWAKFKLSQISRNELQVQALEPIANIQAALRCAVYNAENNKTVAFAHDVLNRFSTLWTFLYEEGVEPTNNLAERALRPLVIFRKLSRGSQSEWGVRFTERLFTVVCTLKQNAKNVFTFLTQLFQAHVGAGPPLSPLS